MKEENKQGPQGSSSGSQWCTWKIIFSLISVQLILLLLYQGYFSSSALVVVPTQLISQRWSKLNLSRHQIGAEEWIFPALNAGRSLVSLTKHVFRNHSNEITNKKVTIENNKIDIHEEDLQLGHTFVDKHAAVKQPFIVPNSIAMGLGITSRKLKWGSRDELLKTFPFFKSFLPTFCKTVSKGYSYNFFLAYDHDDAFYTSVEQLKIFQENVYDFLNQHCTKASNYSLHFVQCSHRKEPARAQNDAMMAAYMSNMEYYYRINDDTRMKSAGWTEIFINTLKSYDPPFVGVVGPKHRGGNTAILTYDFVHYTHILIHGFYYPRPLTDWYADTWITETYRPDRSQKLKTVLLDHTMETGQRYTVKKRSKESIKKIIQNGKDTVNNYITLLRQTKNLTAEGDRVISMSLACRNPQFTYGAIRNAQLMPLYFPTWKLRVYLLRDSPEIDPNLLVPRPIIDKLILLGAQLVFLDPNYASVDPSLWKYLVADDKSTKQFLVRDPRGRLNERDAFVSGQWLQGTHPFFCVRDRKEHSNLALFPGLFGAKADSFSEILQSNVSYSLLRSGKLGRHIISSEKDLLNEIIWPKVKDSIGCFDDVSSEKWLGNMNLILEKKLENLSKIGTWFSEFEETIN